MRAVMLREFGPPSVLVPVELPDPVPGPGRVVVEVEFANITFVETRIRAGRPPNPAMLPDLPAVLGNGVGGVVAEVGDGVDPQLRGTVVVTATGGTGGYAERAEVAAEGLYVVPDGLALDAAVALLADGRTAVGLTDAVGLRPGETVVVEAAAGGVGSLLVQLAKQAGAQVVALAGGPTKLEVARTLDADEAVDYRDADWPEQVRRRLGLGPDDGVDVAFDGVGGPVGRAAFALLRPGGRYCAFGMASGTPTGITPDERPDVARAALPRPYPARLRHLTTRALEAGATGRLRPLIGQRFPLSHAADAHAAIESRTTIGKTLLVAGQR